MALQCSRCKMKYPDNEDNIKEYVCYNRSNNKFKTCIRCRPSKPKVNKTIMEAQTEMPEDVCVISIDATDVSVLLGVGKYNDNLSKYYYQILEKRFSVLLCGSFARDAIQK